MIFCQMNYKIQRYSRLCVQFLETAIDIKSDNFVSVSSEWEESPGFRLSGESSAEILFILYSWTTFNCF